MGVLLGVDMKRRVEWDAVDHVFEGRGVEVKSGAYVQSWSQARPSRIVFDIAPKRTLDLNTNTYSDLPIRPAAVYVFCLWPEMDREICPTDLTQWRFWVLCTARIQQAFGAQKSVGLTAIQKIAPSCDHTGLRDAVIAALAEGAPMP